MLEKGFWMHNRRIKKAADDQEVKATKLQLNFTWSSVREYMV